MAELQELGAWKSGEMVRRYAHFAPEQLAIRGNRRRLLIDWLPDLGSNQGPAD
jgi:hypothetical protein